MKFHAEFNTREEWLADFLKKTHTKVLLQYKISANKSSNIFNPFYNYQLDPKYDISLEEIKEELKTRPHIPNKQEAKALRKLKKKQGN